MEEEAGGRKGAGTLEGKEEEGQEKGEMQDKFNKLFNQPADPWASAGMCVCVCECVKCLKHGSVVCVMVLSKPSKRLLVQLIKYSL